MYMYVGQLITSFWSYKPMNCWVQVWPLKLPQVTSKKQLSCPQRSRIATNVLGFWDNITSLLSSKSATWRCQGLSICRGAINIYCVCPAVSGCGRDSFRSRRHRFYGTITHQPTRHATRGRGRNERGTKEGTWGCCCCFETQPFLMRLGWPAKLLSTSVRLSDLARAHQRRCCL